MSKRNLRMDDDPVMLKGGKGDAEKVLKQRPLLVLFFMTGCPHCESNKPAWEEAKKKVGGDVNVAEIESSDVPAGESVNGFPTMKYVSESGEAKTISGSQPSGDAIISQLGVKKGGSRRRRSTHNRSRRLRNRGSRKLRNRSLRRNVALV